MCDAGSPEPGEYDVPGSIRSSPSALPVLEGGISDCPKSYRSVRSRVHKQVQGGIPV